MAIPAGTRLGIYEVVAQIGAGGMGEVYRAHDTRLNRDVALKVLPEAFARDSERMARFEREAQVLAGLNHPNIAAIYGIEESGPIRALVMELVEGPTLADRVAAGPISLDETLPIARQVAEAVEYAHDRNVIHRDLKPANIKVTAEGVVKVLDFGLAKALANEVAETDMGNSPTLSMAATMQGVILGTAAYMSPEQARGKKVDRRADVWAFGCVFCELLTGKKVFAGEDVSETLAFVMTKEPALDGLPANTPAAVRSLLRRCLDRNLKRRLQHMGEARIIVEDVLSGSAPAEPVAAQGVPAFGRRALLLAAGCAVAASLVAGLAVWNLKPAPAPPARPVTRTVIDLPPGQHLAALDTNPALALSPDGSRLAYVAIQGGSQQIYLRSMDSLETRALSGTEGAANPFFSPDGQWLGFVAGGRLKKVSVSGGAAVTLGSSSSGSGTRGASWGSQGTILFTPSTVSPLQQVPDAGGASLPLTRLEKSEISHRWPDLLPGGQAVLFAASLSVTNWTNAQIAVQSLVTGERRNLIPGGTHPRYASSGHLIYAQGGSLMAVPFDPQRLQVKGTAVPVVEGVLQSTVSGNAQYSISATGSLVYVAGRSQGTQSKLVWISRNGTEQPLPAAGRAYRAPRLSPDGRRIAVTIDEQETQIWLYDTSRDTLTRFTFEGTANSVSPWTPDSKRIVFSSNKAGPGNLFWQLADGSGGLERLTTSEYNHTAMSWSSDGQLFAFTEVNPTTGNDIWVLRLTDHKAQPFLHTSFTEGAPRFSPDGRWLAYRSDESGRNEVYVQPYPGPGGKWQISTEGGSEPIWNPNGRELFYRSGDKMMAVDVTTQPSFSVGKPKVLFEGQYLPTPGSYPNYDVSPDGQRFLMLKSTEQQEQAATQINVVQNWFEELKRRVPTGTK